MAKSQNYTTPKRKAAGNKKNNRAGKPSVVLAPVNRSVQGRGPTAQLQQELVLKVKKGPQQFVLHPSNIPWLAGVAPSHQDWCLANLKVWYEPRVGTTTAGTVSAAIQEDFADSQPPDLSSITRLSGSKRGAPWTPFVLSGPRNRWVPFVNKAAFDSLDSTEKASRSLGRIVVCADVDLDDTVTIGHVFISYSPTASLRKPTDPVLQQGAYLPPT